MTARPTPVVLTRVTVPMRKAVGLVLDQAREYRTRDELVDDLCVAVLTAGDDKTRWVCLTRQPDGALWVFGPYATNASAKAALDTGMLASVEGTLGTILPISPAPKQSAQ